LFPAATADSFGSENVGLNYGFVFTSYGVGGIVGPILAGMVKDAGMSYMYAFVPAAILCLLQQELHLYTNHKLNKIILFLFLYFLLLFSDNTFLYD